MYLFLWQQQRQFYYKSNFIFFSLTINRLNQLIVKLACLMQHRRKFQAKILMKVWVLKLKSVNSKMSGSQSFCGSLFTITVATLCLVIFAERKDQILLAKPNLLLERKSLKSYLFIIIKVRNMKNVQYGISKSPFLNLY